MINNDKGDPNLSENEVFSLIDSFDDINVVSRKQNVPTELDEQCDQHIEEFWEEMSEDTIDEKLQI